MPQSIYRGSQLLRRATLQQLLTFCDIDGTIAGYTEEPSPQEIEARKEVDYLLRRGGLVYSTMRTPELCMSDAAFRKSQQVGFERAEPLCHFDDRGRRVSKPLNTILKYIHTLDPHSISNPGTGIWINKGGAYYQDTTFFSRYHLDLDQWRRDVELLLEEVDFDYAIRDSFSLLENAKSYKNGDVDVELRKGCFEVRYKKSEGGEAWKHFVKERLNSLVGTDHPLARVASTIKITDESVPMMKRYQLYLGPRRLTKWGTANHILSAVAQEAGIPTKEFFVLNIGDRMPDLKAGLFTGLDSKGFFLLAGASPLTEYLVGDKRGQDFAGQPLWPIVRRLRPTGRKGFYFFHMVGMLHSRIVVIADEAYPGKTDAESVHEFLKAVHRI